jgi:ABC-2 type transport system permease protein
MRLRLAVITKKTVGDLLQPKWLGAYLVGYVSIAWFLGLGFSNNGLDGVAGLSLAQQEIRLVATYATMSWFWGVGIPILVLGAIFGANTLAREDERGTLRMLLSKPVRRWEVLLGTFLGIVLALFLVGVASVLLSAVVLYTHGDTAAAALDGGVFAILPANLVFLLVVCTFVAAVAVTMAVATRNRLQTALAGLSLSVSFFVFWLVRLINQSLYEDYFLYLFDASYHLGNVYVLFIDSIGQEFPNGAKPIFSNFSGLYDLESAEPGASVELLGYVDPVVSLGVIVVLAIGLVVVSIYRFERLDI